MPPKKSSPEKASKNSPEKGKKPSPEKGKKTSPEKGKKPTPEKGKKSSPAKDSLNKDNEDGAAEVEYELPKREDREPTPPPIIGPSDTNIMRQHWYKYASEADLTVREWYWNPYCPLLTSWGDLIVSDPPRRKLCCYRLDRYTPSVTRLDDIVVRGEPYYIAEMPKYSRVIVVIRCPAIKHTKIALLNTETKEFEKIIKYQYSQTTSTDEDASTSEIDENRITGVTGYEGLIFVLFGLLQKIEVLKAKTMKTITSFSIQNNDKNQFSCMGLSSSGGCVAGNDKLYIAATGPPRVAVFSISKYDHETAICRHLMDVGLNTLRNPFGVALDSRNMLLVTDSMWDYVRFFRQDGVEIGHLGDASENVLRLRRPKYISTSKNGILAIVESYSNSIKIFVDKQIFNWYRETVFYIDDVIPHRWLVDKLVPNFPAPKPLIAKNITELLKDFVVSDSEDDEMIEEEPENIENKKKIGKDGVADKRPSPKDKSPQSKDKSPPSKEKASPPKKPVANKKAKKTK